MAGGGSAPGLKGASAMDVKDYLKDNHVDYQATPHAKVFTAQEVAAVEHVPGDEVAKPVIVRFVVGRRMAMLVCPASYRVDLAKAGEMLGGQVRLATEAEMKAIFGDAELGAEPPFGSFYDMPTYVDETLGQHGRITFRAGRHTETVTMNWTRYLELERPNVVRIARHL
jgi:Ala-tRNA(Pro) deacylase